MMISFKKEHLRTNEEEKLEELPFRGGRLGDYF